MNPDIQRIAEKWTAKGGFFPNGIATEVIIEALKELSALRDTQERELREKLEQTESMATEDVAYQNTHIIQKDQLIAALRAELARRDEVEKELREEKEALLEGLHNTENKLTDVTVELNGTKKAFKDYVEEMLNELRYRGKVSLEREKEWESELASLRSRIGELEKQLKDLEGESFERDILG